MPTTTAGGVPVAQTDPSDLALGAGALSSVAAVPLAVGPPPLLGSGLSGLPSLILGQVQTPPPAPQPEPEPVPLPEVADVPAAEEPMGLEPPVLADQVAPVGALLTDGEPGEVAPWVLGAAVFSALMVLLRRRPDAA